MKEKMSSWYLELIFIFGWFGVLGINGQDCATFRMASYYASQMVLQRAPANPKIWGFAASGDASGEVTVTIEGVQTVTTTITDGPNGAIWEAEFFPVADTDSSFVITAQLGDCSVQITQVLFGDVWFCSGQSNMQFQMAEIDDPEPDIADAVNYPSVRTFFAALTWSDTPQTDLIGIQRNWAIPTPDNIRPFSSLCWLFGVRLNQKLQIPIGLIESNWGGTRIEAWTSAEALPVCFASVVPNDPPNGASQLYNAMVNPFLPMPIFGAIWYQGESNSGNANLYGCAQRAMVNDWRDRWFAQNPSMDPAFAFGLVQLAPWRNQDILYGFPDVRWAQTDNYGYVPNLTMNKFFMAVAIDLPDYNSPSGDIHPRYKRQIADRLALGSFSVAYDQTDSGIFQGPIPSSFLNEGSSIRVFYSVPLQYRATNGFELCCGNSAADVCDIGGPWAAATLDEQNSNDLTLVNPCSEGQFVIGFRYVWRESPCPLEACALYSVENNLPAPPYWFNGNIGQGQMVYV